MHCYRISGLAVQSEICLPGLMAIDDDGLPDVTIRNDAVSADLPGAMASGPNWQSAEGRFLLRIPAIGNFLLEGGQSIRFEPASGSSDEDLAVFLAGSVFGVLLHQRNHIVLHASAVVVDGCAVLFCGPSGAGKSTLAAALGARGHALVADDLCAIALPERGPPTVFPDGRQLKLWAESIDGLDLSARRGAGLRNRLQKFYVEPNGSTPCAIPIGAIYELVEARPSHRAGISRPNIVDASRAIAANAYRPLLVRRLCLQSDYFRAGAILAERVFTLTRPLRFDALAATIDWLECHWTETGLAETERAGGLA